MQDQSGTLAKRRQGTGHAVIAFIFWLHAVIGNKENEQRFQISIREKITLLQQSEPTKKKKKKFNKKSKREEKQKKRKESEQFFF